MKASHWVKVELAYTVAAATAAAAAAELLFPVHFDSGFLAVT